MHVCVDKDGIIDVDPFPHVGWPSCMSGCRVCGMRIPLGLSVCVLNYPDAHAGEQKGGGGAAERELRRRRVLLRELYRYLRT